MMSESERGPAVLIWNRILVGLDGSDRSMAAVNYAAAVLGGSGNCRIRLVAVQFPPGVDNFPTPADQAAEEKRQRAALQAALDKGLGILSEAGVPQENLSTELIQAHGRGVGQTLMDYQREQGFGTVVVGRRGPVQGRGIPVRLGVQHRGAPSHRLLCLGGGLRTGLYSGRLDSTFMNSRSSTVA